MEGYRRLEKTKYNIAPGDTLRLVNLHWGSDNHLLVIGYHRLVGDGSTTENFFNELGQLYSGVVMKLPSTPFADLALRQRTVLESRPMDEDIDFWVSMHRNDSVSPTSILPILNLIDGDGTLKKQRGLVAPGINTRRLPACIRW